MKILDFFENTSLKQKKYFGLLTLLISIICFYILYRKAGRTSFWLDELYQVSGVGKYKADNYGKYFLHEIQKFVEEHNIEKKSNVVAEIKSKKIKIPKEPKAEKEPTKITTYNLYISGKSIEEIELLREMTQRTIENHF